MAISTAICPVCNKVIKVNDTLEACLCEQCRAPIATEQAIALWDNATAVTLHRKHDPVIRNNVTFLIVRNGDISRLANDGSVCLLVTEREYELPVYITDNDKRVFEGVLAGTGNGKDIEITWAASLSEKTLGVIVSSNDPTARFVERPGAAQGQTLRQEIKK